MADLQGTGTSVKEVNNSSGNKIENSFINTSDNTHTSKGCLIVNWEKKEYSGGKWNGNFKLLGTFEKGDKGFISFLIAKQKAAGKLSLTGLFYALTKDSNNNNGSITHKKSVSTEIEIDESKAETHLPKVGDDLKNGLSNFDWWKFISKKDDVKNVCVSSGSDCTTPSKTTTLRGYGIWKGSSDTNDKKLEGGTGNLSSGGNNLYVSEEIAIPTIASAEKGTWEQKRIDENPKT